MPGIPNKIFKDVDDETLARHTCPKCKLLLRDAVQLTCGHRMCQSCADELLANETTPQCPAADCGEDIVDEDGAYYFPDRFVRREMKNLSVICPYLEAGCTWEGKFENFDNHVSTCKNLAVICPYSEAGCTWEGKFEEYAHHVSMCNFKSALHSELRQFSGSYGSEHGNDLVHCDSRMDDEDSFAKHESYAQICNNMIAKMMEQFKASMKTELQAKDEEIASLRAQVTELEKQIRSKNAELEDRDFRLSLIENSNHDGSMIWKIPQFSQRKADAENGKYTSIFSLPFYSGRYGYKMCLRLYIMGDGIGKGTHLSLFFVVMRGEFDNILQWPFTHKVTFKLINQAGGRHIEPDPISSSFRKPKSDMNIASGCSRFVSHAELEMSSSFRKLESDMNVASGCPQFVSHTELERGGFIMDDTIFIKCVVDTSTIQHP